MKKFKEIKKTGDGTFGVVIKAQDTQTFELVAIKKMKQKYHNFDECTNLREVKALTKLQNHPNIVRLREAFLDIDTFCMVFEFVEKSIYQVYSDFKNEGKIMPEEQIKSIIYQTANGLAHMHKHGFFHRDLKPENLLSDSKGLLKIIDFGLAREIRSRPPYTDYVATRWYRVFIITKKKNSKKAPEILLKQPNYNSPVDIFALGCIMAELYLNRPLFQGNSELDQFNKILSTLGTFTQADWPEGVRLVSQLGVTLAQFQPISLSQIIPNANPEAWNLISQMIRWDPYKRINATQILQHPYFYNIQKIVPSIVFEPELHQAKHSQHSHSVQKFDNQFEQHQLKKKSSNELDEIIDLLADSHNSKTSKSSQILDKNTNYGDYVPSFKAKPVQQQQQQKSSIYNFDNVFPIKRN